MLRVQSEVSQCNKDVSREHWHDKKTLDNWRTEIPALFGFYKEDRDADVTETSQMAVFLHENQDLTQFLRLFLYSFQFPGGHMKAVDVKDIIYNNIRFKPARTIIQVLLAGNTILANRIAQRKCLCPQKKLHIVSLMTFVLQVGMFLQMKLRKQSSTTERTK